MSIPNSRASFGLHNDSCTTILGFMETEALEGDFRNTLASDIHALFLAHGFSERKILNFKRAFREQRVDDLKDLKGIRGLEPLLPFLPFSPLRLVRLLTDNERNSKFVFETHDGLHIESVLMPQKRNVSVCISVQAGCRFGCRFCRTGTLGFKRNLLPHEMLEQVRLVYLTDAHPGRIGCVTFMGMGEPFDNLENCRIAFDWIRSDWGWNIGAKKITFSTTGASGWEEFFSFPTLPNLAVSVHAATEEKRRHLMPRSRIPLEQLRRHMIRYSEITNKQVSVEYCLFRGFNDSREDADALSSLLKGVPCKINLLNCNPVDGSPYEPVPDERLKQFKSWISAAGFPVLYRRSLGVEIGAGCGQLGASLGPVSSPSVEFRPIKP
jgi:23S rRNA (adenine2503-C2)-methyltransferase